MPKKKQHWGKWLAAAACFVVIVGAVTLPRLLQQRPGAQTNAVSRSMPQIGQSETDATNGADSSIDTDLATTPDGNDGTLLAGNQDALTITEPTEIEAVRALLVSPAESETPSEEDVPILKLSDDASQTTIWIDGDDLVYTDDGTQFFRCAGAANDLIDFLSHYDG